MKDHMKLELLGARLPSKGDLAEAGTLPGEWGLQWREKNQILVTIVEPLNRAILEVGINSWTVESNEPINHFCL